MNKGFIYQKQIICILQLTVDSLVLYKTINPSQFLRGINRII